MRALPLEFRMAWGQRLRGAIEETGLSVASFAEKYGYSENRVYKWLAGTVPEIPEIKALAEHLGKYPGWLLFGDLQMTTMRKRTIKTLGLLLGIGLAVGSACGPDKTWALPIVPFLTDKADYVKFLSRRRRQMVRSLRRTHTYARSRRHLRSRVALAA